MWPRTQPDTHTQLFVDMRVEAGEADGPVVVQGGRSGLSQTAAMHEMTAFVNEDPAQHIADYTSWFGLWGWTYQIRLYKAVGLVQMKSPPNGFHAVMYGGAVFRQQQQQHKDAVLPED